jgi:mRNA-degrading endonuclease RelE of RelBE toxin-antitoxin system
VDKLLKLLKKVRRRDKEHILRVVKDIKSDKTLSYNIKKLKGTANVYSIRTGKFRIIYTVDAQNTIRILDVSLRSEKTYKKL